MNTRQLFLQHLAQTSPTPVAMEVARAAGNYLYDTEGNKYLDLIGGISVCNVGHCHPKVTAAIAQQTEQYLHVMVYGELIQSPQSRFAELLTSHLPSSLDCVYLTNSGSEAVEAAIKLAHRVTRKPNIVAANDSYHGHSMGALSVMGSEYWRNAFRPLLPGVYHHTYNSQAFVDAIDADTACVIIEAVQSEAGIVAPNADWLLQLRKKCDEHCALLILDEIQTGFGRTGTLWAFEQLGIVPDILLLGKALGGGMPMGAMVSSKELMSTFTHNPVLGHMTTFGGHPVCCAAGMAAMQVLFDEDLIAQVKDKEALFHELLKHPNIVAVRSKGLLMAIELSDNTAVLTALKNCMGKGLFSDWFLFADNCIRIAPPLTITKEEIAWGCGIIIESLNEW